MQRTGHHTDIVRVLLDRHKLIPHNQRNNRCQTFTAMHVSADQPHVPVFEVGRCPAGHLPAATPRAASGNLAVEHSHQVYV